MQVTFVGYSWNNQGIFLYSIFQEHYFELFPGISLEMFSEYTGNISWECSTNNPRLYICLVGSIVSSIILSIDTFLLSILKTKSLPKHFCWPSMLNKYSEFIRKVLVVWFVKREVDLSLLNMGCMISQVNILDLVLMVPKTNKEGAVKNILGEV